MLRPIPSASRTRLKNVAGHFPKKGDVKAKGLRTKISGVMGRDRRIELHLRMHIAIVFNAWRPLDPLIPGALPLFSSNGRRISHTAEKRFLGFPNPAPIFSPIQKKDIHGIRSCAAD